MGKVFPSPLTHFPLSASAGLAVRANVKNKNKKKQDLATVCVSLNVLSNIWTTRSTWFISDTWTGLRGGTENQAPLALFQVFQTYSVRRVELHIENAIFQLCWKMCLSPALARPGVSVWLKQQSLKWRSPGSSTWTGTTGRRWREQKQSIYNMLPPL